MNDGGQVNPRGVCAGCGCEVPPPLDGCDVCDTKDCGCPFGYCEHTHPDW